MAADAPLRHLTCLEVTTTLLTPLHFAALPLSLSLSLCLSLLCSVGGWVGVGASLLDSPKFRPLAELRLPSDGKSTPNKLDLKLTVSRTIRHRISLECTLAWCDCVIRTFQLFFVFWPPSSQQCELTAVYYTLVKSLSQLFVTAMSMLLSIGYTKISP